MRGAGLVRVEENNESHFLGPSSGIAMTRLVMELAKQNSSTKSIKEIVPETKAKQIKDRFVKESEKPTSKVYPLISSVAAPSLPSRELTDQLVEIYNRKGTLRAWPSRFDVSLTSHQHSICFLFSTSHLFARWYKMSTKKIPPMHTRTLLFAWLLLTVCRSSMFSSQAWRIVII